MMLFIVFFNITGRIQNSLTSSYNKKLWFQSNSIDGRNSANQSKWMILKNKWIYMYKYIWTNSGNIMLFNYLNNYKFVYSKFVSHLVYSKCVTGEKIYITSNLIKISPFISLSVCFCRSWNDLTQPRSRHVLVT